MSLTPINFSKIVPVRHREVGTHTCGIYMLSVVKLVPLILSAVQHSKVVRGRSVAKVEEKENLILEIPHIAFHQQPASCVGLTEMEKVGFYGIPLSRNHKQRLSRSDSGGVGLGSVAAHSSLLRKRIEKGGCNSGSQWAGARPVERRPGDPRVQSQSFTQLGLINHLEKGDVVVCDLLISRCQGTFFQRRLRQEPLDSG